MQQHTKTTLLVLVLSGLLAFNLLGGNTPTAQSAQAPSETAQPLSKSLRLELPSVPPALASDGLGFDLESGLETTTPHAAESTRAQGLPARSDRALDGKVRKPWQFPAFHLGKGQALSTSASAAPQENQRNTQFNLKLFLIVVLVVILVLVLLSLLGIDAGLVLTVALLVALVYVLLLLLGLV